LGVVSSCATVILQITYVVVIQLRKEMESCMLKTMQLKQP
jgi:hypothetical protein